MIGFVWDGAAPMASLEGVPAHLDHHGKGSLLISTIMGRDPCSSRPSLEGVPAHLDHERKHSIELHGHPHVHGDGQRDQGRVHNVALSQANGERTTQMCD